MIILNIENYNYKSVTHGQNVLIGENVKIGSDWIICHNAIITTAIIRH